MAITFSQVKSELKEYAENGLCDTNPRLIAAVNRAQRLLWAERSWLGVMAKYAVNVVAGTVTLPTALESASRITTYTGTGATNGGTLITDSVYAFVHDSDSFLQLNWTPTSPRVYVINASPMPTAVTITGKKDFTPIVDDTTELIIQDVEALRWMLLALWRFDNNEIEMGERFRQMAIQQIANRTDNAIEAARRLNYQTLLSTATINSLDYYRAKLALDIVGGVKVEDTRIVDYLNKAEEVIMQSGKWVGTVKEYSFNIAEDGLVYLPTEIEAILGATFHNDPVQVYDQFIDFHEDGSGFQTTDHAHRYPMLIARGEKIINNVPVRVYYFSGKCDDGVCVKVLAKLRHQYKLSGTSNMTITCYPALKNMVQALMLDAETNVAPEVRQANTSLSRVLKKEALEYLTNQLKEHRGGERRTLQVQFRGFTMQNAKGY